MLLLKPLSTKTNARGSGRQAILQAKLKIGQPGDKYERQADAMADRIMRMGAGEKMQMQPLEEEEEMMQMQPIEEEEELQMKCEECQNDSMVQKLPEDEEEIVQAKPMNSSQSNHVSQHFQSQINNSRGTGTPMDKQTSSFMENMFGTDFSNINIHTNNSSVQLNNQLNSQAFTVGNDVYFNSGKYNPSNNDGKRLLAHELTHTIQQGTGIQPMIQKDDEETAEESSSGSSTPLSDLVTGIVREQLSNSSMRGHLSSLGTALQGLAVEGATGEGEQLGASAERLAALGISGAFEMTAGAILNDPEFAAFRQRIIEFVGSSDEAALIAVLAAGIAAVLADVAVKASPSQDLGTGFSIGGSFDLGTIQSLQFNNLQLYAQFASDYFRTRITGSLSRDDETEEFSGSGTGEVRIGSDLSHLLGRVTINSDGEVVLFGRLSAGHEFGGSDRLVFTTDLTHSFASDETIIQPGVSGRFSLGTDQSLRLGSSLSVSTDSGLTGVTGFIEYGSDFMRIRIEGSMTGLSEQREIMPGGGTRIQGMLTIPLF